VNVLTNEHDLRGLCSSYDYLALSGAGPSLTLDKRRRRHRGEAECTEKHPNRELLAGRSMSMEREVRRFASSGVGSNSPLMGEACW
jgi:hypothetical protein